MKLSNEYLEAYAEYQKVAQELLLTNEKLHDRLVSAVGDVLIALNTANGG